MAEATIPVDLFNPGQVFACLGLVEAAEMLLGEAAAAFDWSEPTQVRFHLQAAGSEDPIRHVLGFVSEARAVALAPHGSSNVAGWAASWGACEELPSGAPYPFDDPDSPATLVAALRGPTGALLLDHWGDTTRDNVKFWAGAAGYPGAALARDALELVRKLLPESAADPFAFARPQSSSFRLDWRRDYIPIDAGFSLNLHGSEFSAVGYPLVELLAAIGLGAARPARRTKLDYRYGVVGRAAAGQHGLWLPPAFLRAALGTTPLGFPRRTFRMHLGWPGKEGQARSITTVIEETDA